MAAEIRTADLVIRDDLLARGERYSYFQAVRLLGLYGRGGKRQENLRVRPRLALGFPENDIDAIEETADGGYRITANFFGLYGVASPLPTYYTEDLFEEQREGRHVMREFLDILHYAMYPLLFEAWSKYRLQARIIEQEDSGALNQLYAFVGLHDADLRVDMLPGSAGLLRYAGLLNQRPRSVLGLTAMLADSFTGADVSIDSCVLRALPIPADQQWHLGKQGHCLGEDAWLGTLIDDYNSHLRIRLANLSQPLFHQLLPGATGSNHLRFLTRFYLIDPFDIEVELQLRHEEAGPARTNSTRWSRLGLDTWIAPQHADEPTQVTFRL